MANDAGAGSTALATLNPAVDKLKEGYEKLQKRDLAVVQAMNRFADLPMQEEDPKGVQISSLLLLSDDEIKQQGWGSRRELRMALYGRLPKSRWPAAMQAAHERVGMRLRKQDKQAPQSTFNLNVISIPAQRQPDPAKIITIEADEKPLF